MKRIWIVFVLFLMATGLWAQEHHSSTDQFFVYGETDRSWGTALYYHQIWRSIQFKIGAIALYDTDMKTWVGLNTGFGYHSKLGRRWRFEAGSHLGTVEEHWYFGGYERVYYGLDSIVVGICTSQNFFTTESWFQGTIGITIGKVW